MSYEINGAAYQQGVFAVPNCVAEDCLRLAGALSLKTLLWMLRHSGEPFDMDALAKALGQPKGEVIDALQYWIDRGIVQRSGEEQVPTQQVSQSAAPAAPVRETPAPAPVFSAAAEPAPSLPPLRPTSTQIADRLEESPELRWLFCEEAPKTLGRTIGYDGQSMLLMLHDTYGLPLEVIPMLLQYCVEAGKSAYNYIEAVGKDWGSKEIDSIEKADEQITTLKQSRLLWTELRRRAGLQAPKPTASQSDYLRRWEKEFAYDIEMIFAAYEEMVEHTGKLSFAYMHKVLQNWHAAGIKTPEEAAAAKQQKADEKAAAKKTAGGKQPKGAVVAPPSYDLDEYERSTMQVPTFAKKGGVPQ